MPTDVHAHLGSRETASDYFLELVAERFPPDEVDRRLSVDGLLQDLDRAAIDRAFVVPMAFEGPLLKGANAFIAEACRAHPDRLFGFGTVDLQRPEHAAEAIDRLRDDGLVGLKLHPAFQRFDPSDQRLFPMFSRAQAVGMPVLIHSGVSTRFFSDRLCRPMGMDDVLCEFGQLVVILAHGGRLWFEEAAMILRKHPNAYIDISAVMARDGSSFPMRQLLHLVNAWTGDLRRVLFGTDYPTYTASGTRAVLMAAARQPDEMTWPDGWLPSIDDVHLILSNADTLVERMGWS